MRYPIVAGSFYPASRASLERELNRLLKNVKGGFSHGLVPHAGYAYSGVCAAKTYESIDKPDTFIILGPNHSGMGEDIALDNRPWLTPLGTLEIDTSITGELNEKIPFDTWLHDNEHSIEVQIPFIQKFFPGSKFVPIIIKECKPAVLGKFIKQVMDKSEKNVSVIASSDLTHYGPAYGFTSFPKQEAKGIDARMLKSVAEQDMLSFRELSSRTTICGKYAVMTLMEIVGKKGKVLKYCNSSEITGDKDNFVGYGSVVFK
jgi:AmmeMemoRadiSam system protein B